MPGGDRAKRNMKEEMKNIMKKEVRKIMAIILAVTLISGLAACGKTTARNTGTSEDQNSVGAEESLASLEEEKVEAASDNEDTSLDEASLENTEVVEEEPIPHYEEYLLEPREVPAGYETSRGLSATELVKELKVGWNLGNTMDAAGGETAWGNPVTTQEMIDTVAAKGFNTIRIPTSWGQFAKEKDDKYMISASWLQRVGEIADYALNNDMYVIINTHHETDWIIPVESKMGDAEERFMAIWTQIASYFQNYGDHIIFEGLNEPREVGSPKEWDGGNYENRDIINRLNKDFVNIVRGVGGNNETRLLLITSEAAAVVDNALGDVRVPKDDPCIGMSLHAYTPYNFTFESATSVNVWNGGHVSDINWLFKQLDKYFLSKGVPVVITEFGAVRKDKGDSNNDEEVCKWIRDYLSAAKAAGVPTVAWDNGITNGAGERFGLLNRNTLTWDRESVVDAMMQVIYD